MVLSCGKERFLVEELLVHGAAGNDADAAVDGGVDVVVGALDLLRVERVEEEGAAGHQHLADVGQVEVGDYLVALVDHEAVDAHERAEVVAAEHGLVLVLLARGLDHVEQVGKVQVHFDHEHLILLQSKNVARQNTVSSQCINRVYVYNTTLYKFDTH